MSRQFNQRTTRRVVPPLTRHGRTAGLLAASLAIAATAACSASLTDYQRDAQDFVRSDEMFSAYGIDFTDVDCELPGSRTEGQSVECIATGHDDREYELTMEITGRHQMELTAIAPITVPPTEPPATEPPVESEPPATEPIDTEPPVLTGSFGVEVGAPVTTADGPESAFALAAHHRTDPLSAATPDSPALIYAEWLRITTPPPPGELPVIATLDGFDVFADAEVELVDFHVVDGAVASFTECRGDECVAIDDAVQWWRDPDCVPSTENCAHIEATDGSVTAYLEATLLHRMPVQMLVFRLEPAEGNERRVIAIDEPDRQVHYRSDSDYFIAVVPDRPEPGSRHLLTVRYDDGTTADIIIFYGG